MIKIFKYLSRLYLQLKPVFIGWDSFIHSSIQLWEEFYIQWIVRGTNKLVVYYDSLVSDSLENTLKTIAKFLHFQWNEHRFGCIQKHNGNPQSNPNCLSKGLLNITSKQFISYATNCWTATENCTFNIYAKKHIIWINSAIRNVQRAIEIHGLDPSIMSKYKNKNVLVSVCSGI